MLVGDPHAARSLAGVVVVANQSSRPVILATRRPGHGPVRNTLEPGGLVCLRTPETLQAAYRVAEQRASARLEPDGVYLLFDRETKQVGLRRLTLGAAKPLSPPTAVAPFSNEPLVVPVKLMVDDDQPEPAQVWEPRLKARVEQVSRLLESLAQVRLEVVQVDRWQSHSHVADFPQLLDDFEQQVPADKARLVIGFTSQRPLSKGLASGGAIARPLATHLLLQDFHEPQREAEARQTLVSLLLRFLGAVERSESSRELQPAGKQTSVDPINALVINWVADALRAQDAQALAELPAATQAKLLKIYRWLDHALPVGRLAGQARIQLADPELVAVTRKIVVALQQAAQQKAPLSEDALTNHFVRAAAVEAVRTKSPDAPAGFLLALGVMLADSEIQFDDPGTAACFQALASLRVEGTRPRFRQATMHKRRYLAEYFMHSVTETVAAGTATACSTALRSELDDRYRTIGFRVVDLAAALAGCRFADQVLEGCLTLDELAASFAVDRFLPRTEQFPVRLDHERFEQRLGSPADPRFLALLQKLDQRLASQPGYVKRPSVTP